MEESENMIQSNGWPYIDNIGSLEGINALHCDTRDFHCSLVTDTIDLYDKDHRSVSRKNHDKNCQIKETELLQWLKSIETMSGGKHKWRFLKFSGIECDGWLKYIRCYRNVPRNPDYFIICNSNNEPIEWKCMSEKTIESDGISE